MSRTSKVAACVIGFLIAAGLIGVTLFLINEGLARADQWSSILNLFLGFLILGVSIYGTIIVLRNPTPTDAPHGPINIYNSEVEHILTGDYPTSHSHREYYYGDASKNVTTSSPEPPELREHEPPAPGDD